MKLLNNGKITFYNTEGGILTTNPIPEGIEMKIPDNVQIIDKHITNSELEKIYNKASIIALPSIDEGFGLSAIEAMSIGKPIIITKNVGMSDIIDKYSPELQNHILNIRIF